MKRILDIDRDAKQVTYHHYNHDTKVTTIETVQDVAPFLRVTQAERNRVDGGAMGLNEISRQQIKDGWWHVARVPASVQVIWRQRYGVDIFNKHQQKEVRRLLNDPEWAYLRNNPGKV